MGSASYVMTGCYCFTATRVSISSTGSLHLSYLKNLGKNWQLFGGPRCRDLINDPLRYFLSVGRSATCLYIYILLYFISNDNSIKLPHSPSVKWLVSSQSGRDYRQLPAVRLCYIAELRVPLIPLNVLYVFQGL